MNISDKYFRVAYKPLEIKHYIPQYGKQYCNSVRELYRVSQQMISEIEKPRMRTALMHFRDLVLMVLEMDTAYRFKVQDVLPEINIERLKKSPVQEIKRMLMLIREREVSADQKTKWRKVIKALTLFLKVSKKKKLIRFFSMLDYDKIRIDEADWYFCLERSDYNYRGINIDNRREERRKIDKEKGHDIPVLETKIDEKTGQTIISIINNKPPK